MNPLQNFVTVVLSLLCFACANLHPPINPSATPDPAAAYIAGTFSRSAITGYAFVIKNMVSNQEYEMSFDGSGIGPVSDHTAAIQVPPGEYLVSKWYSYAWLTKQIHIKRNVANTQLATPFKIDAKEIFYLGKFIADTYHSSRLIHYQIKPQSLPTDAAQKEFAKAYPSFSKLPFKCHLCSDSVFVSP